MEIDISAGIIIGTVGAIMTGVIIIGIGTIVIEVIQ